MRARPPRKKVAGEHSSPPYLDGCPHSPADGHKREGAIPSAPFRQRRQRSRDRAQFLKTSLNTVAPPAILDGSPDPMPRPELSLTGESFVNEPRIGERARELRAQFCVRHELPLCRVEFLGVRQLVPVVARQNNLAEPVL